GAAAGRGGARGAGGDALAAARSCALCLSKQYIAEEAMSYEHILVEVEDGVGIITLNRPEKLNAMNRKLNHELHQAVKQMEADDAIGCIVITGAGERAFSAGGDI